MIQRRALAPIVAVAALAGHAEPLASRVPRSAFLSASLARDDRDLRRRYAVDRLQEAAFRLHELTATCVACHSRLPGSEDAFLSARFLQSAEIGTLPLPQRARLATATRHFDAALAAQEAMLRSAELEPEALDLEGHLQDYLDIFVRVRRDFERPARALTRFAERGDLPRGLARDVRAWIADLRDDSIRRVEGLEAAKAVIEAQEPRAPNAAELLVRYLAASGALHRLVSNRRERGALDAEAYYWMGVVESRIGGSAGRSRTEDYLEAAIRLDPGAPRAEPAYALLEEFVVSGDSGSGGDRVPAEVRDRLDELSQKVEATRLRTAGRALP